MPSLKERWKESEDPARALDIERKDGTRFSLSPALKCATLALATAALAGLLAAATDPPPVKEGLWDIHTQSTDSPSGRKNEGSYQLCRDHAFDKETFARAKAQKGCTMVSENFQDGKYSTEMHCVIGTRTVESKGVTTFQGDTAVHSESHATYTPALGGTAESTIVMEQKYAGSCPADAKPGDRINSDGTIIHLRQPQ